MSDISDTVDDPCIWKVLSLDDNSSTFQSVEKGDKLFPCIECIGDYESCDNYSSHNTLMRKQYHKIKLDQL